MICSLSRFSFESPYVYTMVRDSVDDTFNVFVQTVCNGSPCHRTITVFVGDRQYVLRKSENGDPILLVGGKRLPIPSQNPGVRTEMSAHHVVMSLDSVGASIRYI